MLSGLKGEARQFRRLIWGRSSSPLIASYDLSFVKLTVYDSVWVYAEDDTGAVGLGEAVALPGYGWETTETVCAAIARMLAGEAAKDERVLRERAAAERKSNPFAASAVMTAVDMPRYLSADRRKRFAVNAPVSGEADLPAFCADVERKLALGFEYIKVKVGASLAANIESARAILGLFPDHRYRVIFDANQGFVSSDALTFANVLTEFEPSRLLWFEQPIDRSAWGEMESLCRAATVPIMLDECIYDADDIKRAADIGAFGVKLKLFKNFGITEALTLARLAKSLGLAVVFGNGVATDIGNFGEFLTLNASNGVFSPPVECNGFAKLKAPLLAPMLAIDAAGTLTCDDKIDVRHGIDEFVRQTEPCRSNIDE